MNKSIFKGKNIQKVYKFESYSSYRNNKIPYIIIVDDIESYETIIETELDEPPLDRGDQFYLVKEDKIVNIEKALRGTDNVMVYLTDVVLSTKEETDESLKEAISKRDKYLFDTERYNKDSVQKQVIEDYKRKYRNAFFFVRWFMKKPE